MKLKTFAIGMAVALLLLLALPWLVPMGTYREQAAQLASQKLGVPVQIESLRFALLPTPRLQVGGIRVGRAGDISIADVEAVLDVATLFDEVRVISRLDVQQPLIKSSAMAWLTPLLSRPSGPASVVVRRITLSEARLEWPELPLPLLAADIAMSDAGVLQQATLKSEDGQLTLQLEPQQQGYAGELTATGWTPPLGPPLKLDSLAVRFSYAENQLQLPEITAQLYGGRLTGSLQLDWRKQWQLGGNFNTTKIELAELTRLFSKTVTVSGRISGPGSFRSKAATAGELAQKLVLDYTFDVSRGALHGMDLAKAASLFVKQTGQGGETEFDRLSGRLHMAGKQIELRSMQVASGLLAANGSVSISPAKKLNGLVDVELKKGLALVTVPLQVSGTTDAPLVMPTKAAIAGAAAGTAVLGPMGTGIGMKAGSFLDRMFGDKQ